MRAAEYSLGWSVAEPQERSGFIAQARGAGDSHWPNLNDDEMAHDKKLPPASAGLMRTYAIYLGFRLRLHPRLYSAARIRGLKAASAVNDGAAQNDILAFGTRIGVIERHDTQRVFTGLQVIRAPEVVIKSAFDDIGVNVVEFLAVQKYVCASTFLRHRTDQTNSNAFEGQRSLGACASGDLPRYPGLISVHVIFGLRLIAPVAFPLPRRIIELHKPVRFTRVPLFQLRRFRPLRRHDDFALSDFAADALDDFAGALESGIHYGVERVIGELKLLVGNRGAAGFPAVGNFVVADHHAQHADGARRIAI